METEHNEKGEPVWKNTKCCVCGTNTGRMFAKANAGGNEYECFQHSPIAKTLAK
jgi:hypothetical protein